MKASLRSACSDVVSEYLDGRWPEVDGKSWPELCAFFLDELLTRCPGLSTREYRVALMTRLAVRGLVCKPRRVQARYPDAAKAGKRDARAPGLGE